MKSAKPKPKKNGSKKDHSKEKKSQVDGFLPCFSKHVDHKFGVDAFYGNHVFVGKVQEFMHAIVASPNINMLGQAIHAKGGIQSIDPNGNADDRLLCQSLSWQSGKVYRVDYGKNAYRLLFGLDTANKRCYILALDTNHQTRKGKYR